jgi:hypothetical protein
MRSVAFRIRPGLFITIAGLLISPTFAQSAAPVFLGTPPASVGTPPVSAANISSIGVDAGGNQYYADAVGGQVMEVTFAGVQTTLATGLSHPLIAADFLGDVFVADTGKNRVLKISAQPTRKTVVLASVSGIHAMALDGAENVFLLSGDQVVEIPNNSSPLVAATVPGASSIGFGPGANGSGHLYVVSLLNGAYSTRLYTYSYSGGSGTLSGPLHSFLPDVGGAVWENFYFDPQGNIVIVDNAGGHGKLIFAATSGYKHAFFISSIPTVPFTEDTYGNLYYLEPAGLYKVQLGVVNFGAMDLPAHGGYFPPELTLNFGIPANVNYELTQEPTGGGAFFEGDLQCCGYIPINQPLYMYFQPNFVGYAGGVLNLTDLNGVTTLSIPLSGTGTQPWAAYFLPAQNLKAHPSGLTAQTSEAVRSRCNCGAFTLNRRAGSVSRNGSAIVTGIQNVRGIDVDARGNLYVTQAGVPGVLRVAADGATATIASDIADPGGSALDNPGNLYVISGDDIIRVAPDGSEAVFATPQTNGGYSSLLSIAVDLWNNVYAGYGTAPNSNRGAIVKFTPTAAPHLVRTDTEQPTGLAAYPCGPIYFGDAKRGTVAVVPGDGLEKVIGFGLTNPTNLQCSPQGGVSGQDPGVPNGSFRVSPITFPFTYNFGNVPVGSTRSITLTAVAVGSGSGGGAAGGGEMGPGGVSSTGSPNFQPNQEVGYGALVDIPLSFTPTSIGPYGPYEVDVMDQSDVDSFSGFESIDLSGTGVAPPVR